MVRAHRASPTAARSNRCRSHRWRRCPQRIEREAHLLRIASTTCAPYSVQSARVGHDRVVAEDRLHIAGKRRPAASTAGYTPDAERTRVRPCNSEPMRKASTPPACVRQCGVVQHHAGDSSSRRSPIREERVDLCRRASPVPSGEPARTGRGIAGDLRRASGYGRLRAPRRSRDRAGRCPPGCPSSRTDRA